MSNQKWFQWLVIGLLIANVGLVVFIFLNMKRPPHHVSPKELVTEILHLDEAQQERFDQLVDDHRQKVKSQMEVLLQTKNQWYANALTNGDMDEDSLWSPMSDAYRTMEAIHLQHLHDIQSICRQDQMVYFDSLVMQFPNFFHPPHPRGK
jgi:hypothetical protein